MEVPSPTLRTPHPREATRTRNREPLRAMPYRPATLTGFALYGAWCGLCSGLLAVDVLALHRSLWGMVRPEFLTLNRHAYWMMPLTDGLLLAVAAVVLGILTRSFPRLGERVVVGGIAALASFEVLTAFGGLHLLARVLMAAGCGTCMARRLGREPHFPTASIRRMLVLPLILTVISAGYTYFQITAEARSLAALPPARAKAPNVLLVVLDTVRADHLSLYGYSRDTTPNLKRLAERGVRFDQARAAAPYTMPSHATIFTARWPHELNDVQYSPLDRTYPTLAESLRDHGYRTGGFVGNTYYCNEWFGLDRGFIHYEDIPERRDPSPTELLRCSSLGRGVLAAGTWLGLWNVNIDIVERRVNAAEINRHALDWLDGHAEGKTQAPFFMFVNYIDAHAPYFPPAGYTWRFGDVGKAVHAYSLLSRTQRKKLAENTPQDHQDRTVAAEQLGGAYDDCLGYIDEQLGRLLGALDQRGVLDNTLVIVTSDHGDHIGEHELFGHATSLYQALVHVPLVIVPPKASHTTVLREAGRVVRTPVSLRAIPATVLDVLGLSDDKHPFPGQSLAQGRDDDPRLAADPVLSEVSLRDASRTTRPGQWHSPVANGPMQALAREGLVYIHNGNEREELYHLESDPAERNDLISRSEFGPAVERFRKELKGALTP